MTRAVQPPLILLAPKPNVESKFWARVSRGQECWVWDGPKYRNGYGQFYVGNNISEGAHRFSYKVALGEIPIGMMVLHRCDNRPCVRPDHLFLGTSLDNVRDMFSKGRNAPKERLRNRRPNNGELNGNARLRAEDVIAIRSSHGNTSEWAERFSVAPRTVWAIRTRRLWSTLP